MTTPGTADESASSAGTGDSVERREPLPEGTSSGPMSSAEFRRHGRRIVDWIADYMDRVADLPVQSRVSPGEIRSGAAAHPPLSGEPFEALLADLDRVVLPGITHWQHPGWFAFFPASSSPEAVLAEFVSAGLGVQGMMWSTSPAVTEIENLVMDWLVELLDLPSTWRTDTGPGGGVIQMSASDSTHTALVVARHRATRAGADMGSLVVYTSAQAHSSIEKGARVAGYSHLRLIGTDSDHAMSVPELRRTVTEDRDRGLTPAFLCSTVGTTGTTAVDPVREAAAVATEFGMWHHVDAAFAGSAMVCPEFRHHQDGLELVDSYVFNPHKWMLTTFDCSAFFVADRRPLLEALSILPPYLRNEASDTGRVIDYRDWHVPLGRRFRALKLWWVIRTLGVDGLRAHIRRHVEWAREIESRIEADPRFETIAPTPFSLVSFRHRGGHPATRELADRVNASGRALVTVSELDGAPFVRIAVGSSTTTHDDVVALWDLIDELAPPLG